MEIRIARGCVLVPAFREGDILGYEPELYFDNGEVSDPPMWEERGLNVVDLLWRAENRHMHGANTRDLVLMILRSSSRRVEIGTTIFFPADLMPGQRMPYLQYSHGEITGALTWREGGLASSETVSALTAYYVELSYVAREL